jgi:phosphoribosylformylglycinamidine synthase
LECEEIGEVTDDGRLVFIKDGVEVVNVPSESLVLGGGAPVYDRETAKPQYMSKIEAFNADSIQVPSDLQSVAQSLCANPTIASKRWIYEQYDSMVRTNTTNTNNVADANVIRLKKSKTSLVVSVDCNSAYVFADPYIGAMIAVSEAARNIACTGGKGVAITNCLNFGNPYNPEVYWQFAHAIKGMGEACRKFNTPVTGGNVSFYNQTVDKKGTIPVYPTPTIGMLGILEDKSNSMGLSFQEDGDILLLLGDINDDINQSQYLRQYHGQEFSPAPHFNLEKEVVLHDAVRTIIHAGLCRSAHDISEGGLFINLLESSFKNGLGFKLNHQDKVRADAYLFGESQGRIVISVKSSEIDKINAVLNNKINSKPIGIVTSGDILVNDTNWGNIHEWFDIYNNAIHAHFKN